MGFERNGQRVSTRRRVFGIDSNCVICGACIRRNFPADDESMPQLVAQEIAHFLKQTSLFAILDDESIHRLADRATMQRFSLGETIIEEGDEGRFAYLIFSGRVRVLKRSDSGRQVTLGAQSVGEIFGEQAILTDSPRSASVRATEDVVLFRIDRVDFLELLDGSQNLRQYFDQFIHERSVRDFLRTQTFLEKLRATDVISLLDQLEPRKFSAGEVVVREGASAEVMYIVREGRLKVSRSEGGDEHILGYLSDGDFFGERALLTDEPRSACVVTETTTHCFALSRENFDRLLETSPAIREQLTERFSRYDAANELLVSSKESTESVSVDNDQTQTTTQSEPAPSAATAQAPTRAELPVPAEPSGQRFQKLRTGPRWFEPLPWIAQQDESDCGAASLAMVARYFGIRIPVEMLRRLAQTGYAGVSLYFLSAAAAQIGFRPQATRTTLDQLANARLPAIAHWEQRHYLVLYRMNERVDEFVVGDPARGLLKLTRQQFEDGWTGRLLQLEPTDRLEEHPRPRSVVQRILMSLRNRVPERLLERESGHSSLVSADADRTSTLLTGSVRLENVGYRFSPDARDVLSGINLEALPGQTIAIVGRTGAGKSLLAAILQGSVAPTSGQLLVDGMPLPAGDCRHPFTYSQLLPNRDLFEGLTIAENIALGSDVDPSGHRDLIVAAAELAEANSFIERLPFGYDTPVGNGFAQLSAGEAQLLALAQASLLTAPLLVMDDTLSALPSNVARRILLRLRNPSTPGEDSRRARKRIVVVTSRNVAAIRDADLIVVIDDGHLVETGSHQELIERDGLYNFLWRERAD
jgi:ABC-type multidrug transport system fused ATPase/permease subunit/CRP-like cAMP-binding protein